MQRVNLTYNYGTKEVSNRNRKKIPCLLMEGGCETTTLNSFAYTWDTAESCVMTKILTKDAKMLHYPLTTDQKENQFFFVSDFNDTGKGMIIKLKVSLKAMSYMENPKDCTRQVLKVCELPRRFCNARWRTTNKGVFI